MKFKIRNSLLVLVLAGLCEVWGIELRMDRIHGKLYDQLHCSVITTKMNKVLFSIIEISVTDFSDPLNKVKLASLSALQPGLHIGNENDGSMKATGDVSRYQAKLDIRFSKERKLELGSFLCELTFMRQSGFIDKIYSVVKPDLSDVNNLTDNSELILAVQVNELRNQFADTVNVLTNRTAAIEESLAELVDRMELTDPPSSNTTTCLADKSLQEIKDSLNKMANGTKGEMDQLTDTTTLHKDQADHLTNLTEQLSITVNQISDSTNLQRDETKQLPSMVKQISDSVDAVKNKTENNEATLARLISHVEAMDARLTTMSTVISRLDKVFPERRTEKHCYKGVSWEVSSPRIPVLVMGKKTALCDTVTDYGGWIIIQRRVSGDVDFYRGWEDYKNGFGDVTSDYWLGNDLIHQLTSLGNFQLRVDMMYQGQKYYAQYTSFSVGSESSNYTLSVDGYSGDAGDSLKYHSKKPFSTYDHASNGKDCPVTFHGAWWYHNCYESNLNGKWGEDSNSGMTWHGIVSSKALSLSEMKIRLS